MLFIALFLPCNARNNIVSRMNWLPAHTIDVRVDHSQIESQSKPAFETNTWTSDGPAASGSNTVHFIFISIGLVLCSTMPYTKIDQPKLVFGDYRVHRARLHAISATCKRPIYLLYRNRAIDVRKKKKNQKWKRGTHTIENRPTVSSADTGIDRKKNHNSFRIPNGKKEFTRTIACYYYNKIKSDSLAWGKKFNCRSIYFFGSVHVSCISLFTAEQTK